MNIPARPGIGTLGEFFQTSAAETDPAVSAAMDRELHRQRDEIRTDRFGKTSSRRPCLRRKARN
jgi:hypothetical protein